MKPPTERQAQVFYVLLEFSHEHGYPPTIAELADLLELSVTRVFQHLKALQRRGLIERHSRKGRGIQINGKYARIG